MSLETTPKNCPFGPTTLRAMTVVHPPVWRLLTGASRRRGDGHPLRIPEIAVIRDVDGGKRPGLRRVDQLPIGVKHMDAGDIDNPSASPFRLA